MQRWTGRQRPNGPMEREGSRDLSGEPKERVEESKVASTCGSFARVWIDNDDTT